VEPIRLLLVDDRTAIRHGLRMQLELEADVRVIGEAGDGTGAIALAEELDPDVVVMDVKMTPMDGITATELLHRTHPETAVVVLTLHDDAATRERAKAAGARGFVGKHESTSALLAAVRQAARPRPLGEGAP
jgi:DNA-binding NarL/FixJ family response regulator